VDHQCIHRIAESFDAAKGCREERPPSRLSRAEPADWISLLVRTITTPQANANPNVEIRTGDFQRGPQIIVRFADTQQHPAVCLPADHRLQRPASCAMTAATWSAASLGAYVGVRARKRPRWRRV
jgi:hypothetical protein